MPLSIQLDFDSQTHLFKQLVSSIKKQIETGELTPGTKLPSTRQLAKTLKISRSTTSAAYNELNRLGLIENATHAGSFVERKTLADSPLLNFAPDDETSDFPQVSTARLPRYLLPSKKWNSLLLKHQRFEESSQCNEKHSQERLQRSLAFYLERARGISTHPNQIVIFGNAHQALNAISTLLINQGDTVALENPCNPVARSLFLARGANLAPVSVDTNGLIARQLNELQQVKLVFTTPSNQTPLGVSLSQERRHELLNISQRQNSLIIEDDCDHELVYGTGNIPALKALDQDSQVIYLSSLGKTLSPLTEIAFVVAPSAVTDELVSIRTLVGGYASEREQVVLASMLEEGHLERHLQSLRICFSARRRIFIEHLAQTFGHSIYLYPNAMGTSICARFKGCNPQGSLLKSALNAGLPAQDATSFFVGPEGLQHLLFSIPHLDEDAIAASVVLFKNELNQFDGYLIADELEQHKNGYITGVTSSILSRSSRIADDWQSKNGL